MPRGVQTLWRASVMAALCSCAFSAWHSPSVWPALPRVRVLFLFPLLRTEGRSNSGVFQLSRLYLMWDQDPRGHHDPSSQGPGVLLGRGSVTRWVTSRRWGGKLWEQGPLRLWARVVVHLCRENPPCQHHQSWWGLWKFNKTGMGSGGENCLAGEKGSCELGEFWSKTLLWDTSFCSDALVRSGGQPPKGSPVWFVSFLFETPKDKGHQKEMLNRITKKKTDFGLKRFQLRT